MNYLQLCLSNLSFLKEYFMCPRIKSVTPGSFKRQGIHPWMFVRIFKTAGPFCRRISGNPANPYRGQGELSLLPPWPSWKAINFSCCWASNAPGFECQVLEEALGRTAQLRREAMLGRGGAEGRASSPPEIIHLELSQVTILGVFRKKNKLIDPTTPQMRSTHMPASISKNRSSGIQAAAGFLFGRQGRLESRRPTVRPESGNSRNPLLGVQSAGENQQTVRQFPTCSACVETTRRKKELKISSEHLWEHERRHRFGAWGVWAWMLGSSVAVEDWAS